MYFKKLRQLFFKKTPQAKPPEKWVIKTITLKDKQSYFESDIKLEYQVLNQQTGLVLKSFFRSEYDNDQGSVETGVCSVEFSEDKTKVIAYYEDGRVEEVVLD